MAVCSVGCGLGGGMKLYSLTCALSVCAILSLPTEAYEYCAMRPPKGATEAQLSELANISQAVAQEIALNQIPSQGEKTVERAQLQVARGCLIWALSVRVAGQAGVQEIHLDADTGRVIGVLQKSPRQQLAKAAKDRGPRRQSGQTPPR